MKNPNAIIWRPTLKNHVESYFVKLNLVEQSLALWIRFTFFAPKESSEKTKCELWAIFFDADHPENTFGIKNSFSASEAEIDYNAPKIKVKNSIFAPPYTKGEVKQNNRLISWEFELKPLCEPLIHFPHEAMYRMYRKDFPKTKLVSPYPHAVATGRFCIDSKELIFKDVPAMQGHNWGKKHLHKSAWAHTNCFEGRKDVYFEGLSANVTLKPVPMPKRSLAFLYREGELIKFNTLESFISGPIEISYNMWRFTIKGRGYALEGEISAPAELFVALRYYNPDGSFSYCLNSSVATAHLILREQKSGKVVDELFSPNSCSLEIHTPNDEHGVKVLV